MNGNIIVERSSEQYGFTYQHFSGKGGLDYEVLGNELSAIADQMVKENPDIGAILLECTDMPPYAHRIQAEQNLPVFDAITLIKYVKSTVTQTPYYGFL